MTLSESGKYYKQGNDVFETATGRHIELPEFKSLGLNFALLPDSQTAQNLNKTQADSTQGTYMQRLAQSQIASGATPGTANPPATPPPITPPDPIKQFVDTFSSSQDPQLQAMATTLQTTQQYLDKLIAQGQTVNPSVVITPEMSASFLAQAQREIDPYYASQMSLARQSLLQSAGYSTDQITAQENQWEKQYGQNLRQIGANAAETGTALSGGRQLNEQNLASDTQFQIDQARKGAQFNAQQSAQQYAQQWGTANVPQTNIAQAPRVLAGQADFVKGAGSTPFYSLSDNVYSGLVGSQDYAKQTAEQTRASELESAMRANASINSRKLTL